MPKWEIEITDARGGWGTKGFPISGPGTYVTEDPFVAERAELAAHVFVRELKPQEETAAKEAAEEAVEAETRVGPLTVQDLRAKPAAVKTCEDCGRTYKRSHKRCPGPPAPVEAKAQPTPEEEPEGAEGEAPEAVKPTVLAVGEDPLEKE